MRHSGLLRTLLGRTWLCGLAAALVFVTGCTSRGLTITSVPEGAEVSINRRVVGVTPIRVGFTHYGTYRIELRKDKHQVLVREEAIKPPIYGYDPMALVADNAIPARLNDEVYLHYVMKSLDERTDKETLSDRDALMERAELARGGNVINPRTGAQHAIALTRPTPGTAVASAEEDEQPLIKVDTQEKPSELTQVIRDINVAKPEGIRLASELNIEAPKAPVDNKGVVFKDPHEGKPAEARPKVIRTPKDEELIFDEPEFTVPGEAKKDGKADAGVKKPGDKGASLQKREPESSTAEPVSARKEKSAKPSK